MKLRNFIRSIFNISLRVYQNKKLLLVFIFCLSVLASLFFITFLKNIGPEGHNIPGSDYFNYYEPVAESISQGKGIPAKEGNSEEATKKIGQGEKVPAEQYLSFRYPIGYPLILSALFYISDLLNIEKLNLIVIFNILVTALATCFLFLFVKSIFNKEIALISSFLWMTYPFNLWFIKNPNTEVPFILFFYLALWIYILGVKKSSIGLFSITGVLIGFMSLIRPISVFLPIPFAILIFFLVKKSSFGQKILFSLVLIVAYIAVISPWIIYIYLNIGKTVPLSTQGHIAISYGLTLMVDIPQSRGESILPNDVVKLIERSRERRMERRMDSPSDIAGFLFQELINHPISFFKLLLIKMARSWYATSSVWWEKEILLVQLIYLIPGIAGIVLWFKKFKEKLIYLAIPLTIIFYFWALTIVAYSIMRYMIPIMGIVMIFVSITFCYLLDNLIIKIRKKNEA